MIATDRKCPTRRCGRMLTEAEAQTGELEGQWVEACFSCGYTKAIPRPVEAMTGDAKGKARP